ncbi:metallophosphoesterase [Humisphaera borealis]|uniref:Metallophosphoesterase n=1 Tax=Humisphaera borealis TaxID=2807512 RepID=A0A7M2WPP7_9BACT|nr:metallophosphoesterase [Humisphaera borealis]QOV87436.1 metallophosphoesterase [Humisphaera borealis]
MQNRIEEPSSNPAVVPSHWSRRGLLKAAVAGAGTLALPGLTRGDAPASPTTVSFFLVGDTHYYAPKEAPDKLDEASQQTNSRLIDWLNKLPGTAISADAAGGPGATVPTPMGVIHAGDLIDSGDKGAAATARKMQDTEWAAFLADWGLNGGDAKLKWPVFEIHGNHDGPRGDGPVVADIINRNKKRKAIKTASDNGLHYAWNWGGVHFLNLGIVVGGSKEVSRARRYDPKGSLGFLEDYLAKNVGESGAPVVVTHHVDMARYSQPCGQELPKGNPEWDPCDVKGYHQALAKYNVIGALFGHTHVRKIARWDGTPKEPAVGGVNYFNTDNAGHYHSATQAILHFEIGAKEMVVREFATKDSWETGAWTPQAWKFAIKRG